MTALFKAASIITVRTTSNVLWRPPLPKHNKLQDTGVAQHMQEHLQTFLFEATTYYLVLGFVVFRFCKLQLHPNILVPESCGGAHWGHGVVVWLEWGRTRHSADSRNRRTTTFFEQVHALLWLPIPIDRSVFADGIFRYPVPTYT